MPGPVTGTPYYLNYMYVWTSHYVIRKRLKTFSGDIAFLQVVWTPKFKEVHQCPQAVVLGRPKGLLQSAFFVV